LTTICPQGAVVEDSQSTLAIVKSRAHAPLNTVSASNKTFKPVSLFCAFCLQVIASAPLGIHTTVHGTAFAGSVLLVSFKGQLLAKLHFMYLVEEERNPEVP
jgi:hypothetical protein